MSFTDDTLLGGRVLLRQPAAGFRAALDPVLLAAFVPAREGEAVLEAGCGTGAAFLCLAARVPGLRVAAVERDAGLAELARHNAAANRVAAEVFSESLERAPSGPFDHALANPPWWPAGTPPPDARRRAAGFEEGTLPLAAWVAELARRLRHKGTLSLALPAARFSEGAAAMRASGLGAVTLLPLAPRAGEPAKRCLIRARRGGRGPDVLLPPLVLHADGGFTPEADAALRGAAALGGG